MSMFNYLNLHTVYACSGEFTESVYPDGDYCFRRIFHRREILSSRKHIEETYNVYMFKGSKRIRETNRNNA